MKTTYLDIEKPDYTHEIAVDLGNIGDGFDKIDNELGNVSDVITVEDTTNIISLPSNIKDGILQGSVKGMTVVNSVINGNFANGTTEWSSNSTLSASNNTLRITGNGTSSAPLANQTLKIVATPNRKIYLRARARVTNSSANSLYAYLKAGVNINNAVLSKTSPVENTWYTLSGIGTIQPEATGNLVLTLYAQYSDAATANGKVMEAQDVMVIDLTAMFGEGNEPDLATCDKIFLNYIDGLKSVENITIKSTGKNLFDGNWLVGKYVDTTGALFDLANYGTSNMIPIKPNTAYTLALPPTATGLKITWYDKNQKYISHYASSLGYIKTETSPSEARYARISYVDETELPTAQFEEGTVATSYEPYESTEATINVTFRKLPNGVCDEITLLGDKIQRIAEYVLQSADIISLGTTAVNYDYVTISLSTLNGMKDYGVDDRYATKLLTDKTAPMNMYTVDSPGNTWKHYINAGNWVMTFPKGTYANLAAAQTALAGTKVIFELAQPTTEKISVKPLLAKPKGTITVETSTGVIPTLKCNCPNNLATVVKGLLKALARMA